MKRLLKTLRNFFITGFAVTTPFLVTVMVFLWLFKKLDHILGIWFERYLLNYYMPGLGLVALFIIVLSLGFLARNVLGRFILKTIEKLFVSLPVSKNIYTAVNQIQDMIKKNKKLVLQEAVLVRYIFKNMFAMGYTTNKNTLSIPNAGELMSVFVPTTPNPTSGYMILAKPENIVKLGVSLEDGMKFNISGGLIVPQSLAISSKGDISGTEALRNQVGKICTKIVKQNK
jgi:uncharacterized membrane protein